MLEQLGEFKILGELGRGNMGVVYRAFQPSTRSEVALKVMARAAQAAPGSLARFEQECQAASRLNHPNIVRVVSLGTIDDSPYMAMEVVEGQDLDEILRTRGALDPDHVAELGIQLAQALDHAHGQRVLHRDLKPANVMLHPTRGALLTDFGLGKVFGSLAGPGLTRSSDLLGSPIYMAPEQAASQHDRVGARTDVYGLGAILYEMLSGNPPCYGTSLQEVLFAVVETVPPAPSVHNPLVSSKLDAIVLKCLAKDPDERYASAAEVAAALEDYLAAPVAPKPGLRLALGLGGVALATLAVGAALVATRTQSGDRDAPALSGPSRPALGDSAATDPPEDTTIPPPAETTPRPTGADPVPSPVSAEPPPSPLPADDMDLLNGVLDTQALQGLLQQAEQGVERAPELARAHLDLGRARLALGDLPRALEALQDALILNPELAAGYRVRGMIYTRTAPKRVDAAQADFERALELDPEDWQTLRERGVMRWNQGAQAEAFADLDASLRLHPSASVHSARGFIYGKLGRLAEAEREFRLTLKLEPRCAVELQNVAEFARARGEWREASDLMARYLKLRPTDAIALQTQLDLLVRLKERERVVATALALEALDPAQTHAPLQRATALLELDRPGGAYDALRSVLAREPTNKLALLLTFNAQVKLEVWGPLVKTCDRIVALEDPPNAETLTRVREVRAIAAQRAR